MGVGPPSGAPILIVLDENIAGDGLRDALMPAAIAAGARVDLHTVYWPRGTKDPTWMPIAADRRLAMISGDVSVRYNPAEKEIIKNAGVCMYILRGSLNGDQIRDALVKALPTICRRHRQLVPPVICYISRHGEVVVKEGVRRGEPKSRRRHSAASDE